MGHAVDDGVGAGGVVANDAANGGAVCAGGVGAKGEVVRREDAVEVSQGEAGLNAGGAGLGVNGDDAVHVAGEVEDEGFAHSLPG